MWNNEKISDDWEKIFEIRNFFLSIVEQKRNAKELKSSMEAKVNLYLNDKNFEIILKRIDLCEILICSDVVFVDKFDDSFKDCSDKTKIKMKVEANNGEKCQRSLENF